MSSYRVSTIFPHHACSPTLSPCHLLKAGPGEGNARKQSSLEQSVNTYSWCRAVAFNGVEVSPRSVNASVCALRCASWRAPPLTKRPVPPVPSQTAVRTCATETASAPWGSRVGTANARRAGGDLAAASRWRPLVPTTRTTKEVNWGQWSSGIKRVGSSLALCCSHSFCLLREMRKESQFGLCQRIGDYGESEVSSKWL